MIRKKNRIFRIHIFFNSYGEFGDIKIKLLVEVTAAADNLGQRGQSIILR